MSQALLTKHALAKGLKIQMRHVPFLKITVEDICNSADVSRRNFYRHFKDKYELLTWIYETDFCSTVVHQENLNIWDYFPGICQFLYDDREFFINAFSFEGQNSFREFCMNKLYPLLMHDFGSSFDSEEIAVFCIQHLTNAVFDGFQIWLMSEPCMPPDQYALQVQRIVTKLAHAIYKIGE